MVMNLLIPNIALVSYTSDMPQDHVGNNPGLNIVDVSFGHLTLWARIPLRPRAHDERGPGEGSAVRFIVERRSQSQKL